MHKIKPIPISKLGGEEKPIKVVNDETIKRIINSICSSQPEAISKSIRALELKEVRCTSFDPCFVSTQKLSPRISKNDFAENGIAVLDLREYLSLTNHLNCGVHKVDQRVILADEYIHSHGDWWNALSFCKKHGNNYPKAGSGYWWSSSAFAEHLNYFLTEEYDEWYIACKYITAT